MDDENQDDVWTQDADSDYALRAASAKDEGVVPARSVALYARWWQLETWLRELAYVELRALAGTSWTTYVKAAAGRQNQDAPFTHMAGADNDNPLAYLDYSQLIEVIEKHWQQFGYALIEHRSWAGRQDELKRIRHRIGHLRRPHRDDLARLEQTLRDLENGAFRAMSSYNDRWVPTAFEKTDAVAVGWLSEEHSDAKRLIDHAERQYGTRLLLRKSRRPWAAEASGPGNLWHVDFLSRERYVDIQDLWRDQQVASVKPLLVHLSAFDWSRVGFTFSAADDGQAVADAIGNVFDAVLTTARWGCPNAEQEARWTKRARSSPDYRVLVGTGWNIVDETTLPITLFGAGAGVDVN